MRKFDSILVANRGEIAVRIMRTAKSLGYRTIAVYSDADSGAAHVAIADDSYHLGASPASESYLNIDRLLQAAKITGASAIHPGYGFLSENARFAAAVESAGMTFIGPSPDAIALMGNKAEAKERMLSAGVPCVPGYQGSDQSDERLLAEASRIGFPVMVKAAAGGGGRGMRLVQATSGLLSALQTARSEAANAFGSDELILERAIVRPRHVEVQVFADTQGNTVHLGERDCSVQRRHQKVVEESPCPVMTEELRRRMGQTAVNAARNIQYRGAGTIEFLLDQSGEYYFLEMNTRLQVEHPVTEFVTGLDLVALQIRVADGAPLGFDQADVHLHGHAIEVRLYAEDPSQSFLPMSGRVLDWRPASGEGVRIDAGILAGQDIPSFYDPMLAKVIAWGADREEATARLVSALRATHIFGPTTNKAFLIDILETDAFRHGDTSTAFIAEQFPTPIDRKGLTERSAACVAVLHFLDDRRRSQEASLAHRAELDNWTSRGRALAYYQFKVGHDVIDAVVTVRADHYSVEIGKHTFQIGLLDFTGRTVQVSFDNRKISFDYLRESPGVLHVGIEGHTFRTRNELAFTAERDDPTKGGRVTAVMHGTLVKLFVNEGDPVTKGMPLLILEAMKMQHEICAPTDGIVSRVAATAGSQVAADDLLLEIGTTAGGSSKLANDS